MAKAKKIVKGYTLKLALSEDEASFLFTVMRHTAGGGFWRNHGVSGPTDQNGPGSRIYEALKSAGVKADQRIKVNGHQTFEWKESK